MIIELAIIGGAVAAVGTVSSVLIRRKRAARAKMKAIEEAPAGDAKRPGFNVGDVILHVNDEYWLAGELDVTDSIDAHRFCVRLFASPGSRHAWVAQLSAQGTQLGLLSETDAIPAGTIPDIFPIEGLRYRLSRRGNGSLSTHGELDGIATLESVPATYTVLTAPGRVAVVLESPSLEERLTLTGESVEDTMFEHLPS